MIPRTAILRHRASDYGLEMQNDGFVLVADLLKLSKNTAAGIPLSSHSVEDVRKVSFFFTRVHAHVKCCVPCFYSCSDPWLANCCVTQ